MSGHMGGGLPLGGPSTPRPGPHSGIPFGEGSVLHGMSRREVRFAKPQCSSPGMMTSDSQESSLGSLCWCGSPGSTVSCSPPRYEYSEVPLSLGLEHQYSVGHVLSASSQPVLVGDTANLGDIGVRPSFGEGIPHSLDPAPPPHTLFANQQPVRPAPLTSVYDLRPVDPLRLTWNPLSVQTQPRPEDFSVSSLPGDDFQPRTSMPHTTFVRDLVNTGGGHAQPPLPDHTQSLCYRGEDIQTSHLGMTMPSASQHHSVPMSSTCSPAYLDTPTCHFGREGERIAHVHDTAKLGHYASQPVPAHQDSSFNSPAQNTSRAAAGSKPRYKDLRYDGKTSWKAFLHKFVRLSRSQLWTEEEQHDQFCFSLEGAASEYYTLLLETSSQLRLGEILQRFEKRFGPSAPDLTHQLNFQSACQNPGESLHQWADRVLTLATRAFPSVPDVHTHAIPRLCYGAEDRDAGLYALDGHPRTVEEAVECMQYYQHSRRHRPKPSREVRKLDSAHYMKQTDPGRINVVAVEELAALRSRIENLEELIRQWEAAPLQKHQRSGTPSPRWTERDRKPAVCFRCGEVGHFRRDCPTRAAGKTVASDGQRGGTSVGGLPVETSPRSDSKELGISVPRSCVWRRHKRRRLKDQFGMPPSPELCLAEEEVVTMEEKVGTPHSTLEPFGPAMVGDEPPDLGRMDPCGVDLMSPAGMGNSWSPMAVGLKEPSIHTERLCGSKGFMVGLCVEGMEVTAVVDTGAEVSVLSTRVYDQLEPKPPILEYVTMRQAGENAELEGFIAGPVTVCIGQQEHEMKLYVAPLQDSMLLGMDFLRARKAQLDLGQGTLTLGDEAIRVEFRRSGVIPEEGVTLTGGTPVEADRRMSVPRLVRDFGRVVPLTHPGSTLGIPDPVVEMFGESLLDSAIEDIGVEPPSLDEAAFGHVSWRLPSCVDGGPTPEVNVTKDHDAEMGTAPYDSGSPWSPDDSTPEEKITSRLYRPRRRRGRRRRASLPSRA
ncbi:uncharacterized protein LOC134277010 [Saccostrea cucullata]|uniref:uncharacterized protein LOC134277010 n=1 Tax=Saccostrea cuccullata TaxID=36930 RepID=UPI002ED1A064